MKTIKNAMTQNAIKKSQLEIGRSIAIGSDLVQFLAMPLFGEGFLSPLNDFLDIGTGIALCSIVGFHPVFVPTFFAEEIPVLDVLPTWTAAFWFATKDRPII